MKTAFEIYIKAVGIYALITIPALVILVMYVMSLGYVLTFGWFAWFLFSLVYFIADRLFPGYRAKFAVLFFTVIVSVAFAFNMIGVLDAWEDVWYSGFIIFPALAVVAGWISLYVSRRRIRHSAEQEDNQQIIFC